MRTDNEGNYRNSAPCKNCFNVICQLNIKKIIFSSDENSFEIHKPKDYKTTHISHGNRYLQALLNDNEKKGRINNNKKCIKCK